MHSTITAAATFLSLLSLTTAHYNNEHHYEHKNIDVTVGADAQLKFNPENVKANIGDTLTFTFFPKNHSVVQSNFDNPCKPLKDDNTIFSGFQPVADGQEGAQKFVATVRDDKKPIWLYCAQTTGNHCQSGMAMVVNEPAEPNTLAQYKENAKNSGVSEVPPTIGGGVFRPNEKYTPPTNAGYQAGQPPAGQYDQGTQYQHNREGKSVDYKQGQDKGAGWPQGGEYKEGQKDGATYDKGSNSYSGGNAYMRARAALA